MSEAQQSEIESDAEDWTVEGEWNRALQALEAAQDALQNLAHVWEDRVKADIVGDLVNDVKAAIDTLEATNG